jgi:hypothetical protein
MGSERNREREKVNNLTMNKKARQRKTMEDRMSVSRSRAQ